MKERRESGSVERVLIGVIIGLGGILALANPVPLMLIFASIVFVGVWFFIWIIRVNSTRASDGKRGAFLTG